jgi:hypothetical protein
MHIQLAIPIVVQNRVNGMFEVLGNDINPDWKHLVAFVARSSH